MSEHYPFSSLPNAHPESYPGHIPHDPGLHDVSQLGSSYPQPGTPANTSIFGVDFRDQHFWKGALLGAAVTLIVTNDSVQKAVIKTATKLYGAVQGGAQEIKEKFEDIQAELRQKDQEE